MGVDRGRVGVERGSRVGVEGGEWSEGRGRRGWGVEWAGTVRVE